MLIRFKFHKNIIGVFLIVVAHNFLDARDDHYKDRLKIYIDNSITDFKVFDHKRTSEIDLNKEIEIQKVKVIKKWLPNARPSDQYNNIYLNRYYIIKFDGDLKNIGHTIGSFINIYCVSSVELVPLLSTNYIPNDYFWEDQYGMMQIKADSAYGLWDIENGEIPGQMPYGEIVVGVVDISLMWDHPDLINNVWRNMGEDIDGDGDVLEYIDGEWVFDPGDTNSIDDDGDGYVDNFIGYDIHFDDNDPDLNSTASGHGTMVSGCVSAVTNNEIGISSVGWSVKIMGVNSSAGGNTLESGYAGILAAAHMGADIINLSWGNTSYWESHETVINTVYNEYDCILVGAAGNSGAYEPHYPASYENVISVTATSMNNYFNCWPTYHETVDIAAPGEDILTTVPFTGDGTRYQEVTGTSFSSPTVAGGIALLKTVFPHADNEMLSSNVLNSTSYFEDMDGSCSGQELDGLLGSGQLNMHRSLVSGIEPGLSTINVTVSSSTGLFSPGDTSLVTFSLSNSNGSAPIENISATLTSLDSLVTVINDQFVYDHIVGSGHTFEVSFLITSSVNASYGDIPFELILNSDISGNFPTGISFESHETQFEVFVPFGFNQDGYPIQGVSIFGSPLITDLYGNSSIGQVYFIADSIVYGKWVSGLDVLGFPFSVSSRISSHLSAGDLDGDNDKELLFGTVVGDIYALKKDGSEFMVFSQPDSIISFISLYSFDEGSEELDILFISKNDSISTVHLIDLTGEYFSGFPIVLEENIVNGVAIADIDLDGMGDIIVGSHEGQLYAFDREGSIKSGFPVNLFSNINTPVSLANMDEDSNIEIMVGLESGEVFVIDHDGTIVNSYASGGAIYGGLSIADIDQDNSMEIIFNSDDHKVHAWEPQYNEEVDGWPVHIEGSSITEPILTDLNNDLYLEVVNTTIEGDMHIIKHDGSSYDNFPYISNDSIYYSPAVGDIDSDGDLEIFIGTNENLRVIDILDELGDQYSWSAYRNNSYRDGFYDTSQSYLEKDKDVQPNDIMLENNYPNPFNPSTVINFTLPEEMYISINIYNINGRCIKTIMNGNNKAGCSSVEWDGLDKNGNKVSSGIYFYELKASDLVYSKKMILLK